ncbi:MAG: twin-arginine translocation signal domain-containing protein [Anaerolineae bacterium]|nr:twin-arginine translocation signal domain-containing protein [Anaerolineae bacterium]
MKTLNRRDFLRFAAMAAAGTVVSACATPEVIEKEVTREVEKVVTQKETVIVTQKETVVVAGTPKVVEKQVTQIVEKVVTPTPAPEQMAEDQTLIRIDRSFGILNPAAEGGSGRGMISHMWMPLFIRDENHDLSPWLAEGFEVNEDGTVYNVQIKNQAVWSDGTPVTAQEAKEYWAYALSTKRCLGCYFTNFTGWATVIEGADLVRSDETDDLAGVVALDDKTIQFTLKGPDPIFLQRLALFDSGFCKMEDVNAQLDAGVERFAADASTRVNGPYKIKVWDTETKEFELVLNENWWGPQAPVIERIVCLPQPDENITLIQWYNGEVDVAFFFGTIKEQIRQRTPEVFHQMPYATNFFYRINAKIEPFDDINVRRALCHAVDWNAAIHAAWEGILDDRVMNTILTPELTAYKEGNWPDWGYDPEKAKQELAASKYGGPENLPKIRISPGGTTPAYIRTAEVMMEQWKQNLGITNVEMKPGWGDAWGQEADLIQLGRASLGAIIPDEVNFLYGHYNRDFTGDDPGYVDEELGAKLEALQLMSREDPNYVTSVQEAEAQLLSHYPLFGMVWERYEYAVQPWVKNFRTNVDNNFASLIEMYIADH